MALILALRTEDLKALYFCPSPTCRYLHAQINEIDGIV